MNIHRLLNSEQLSQPRNDLHNTEGSQIFIARQVHSIARQVLVAVTLTVGVALLSVPAWAQTEDDLAKQYKMETMEQALKTKEQLRSLRPALRH